MAPPSSQGTHAPLQQSLGTQVSPGLLCLRGQSAAHLRPTPGTLQDTQQARKNDGQGMEAAFYKHQGDPRGGSGGPLQDRGNSLRDLIRNFPKLILKIKAET